MYVYTFVQKGLEGFRILIIVMCALLDGIHLYNVFPYKLTNSFNFDNILDISKLIISKDKRANIFYLYTF